MRVHGPTRGHFPMFIFLFTWSALSWFLVAILEVDVWNPATTGEPARRSAEDSAYKVGYGISLFLGLDLVFALLPALILAKLLQRYRPISTPPSASRKILKAIVLVIALWILTGTIVRNVD